MTYYQSVRVSDTETSTMLAPSIVRWSVRQRLSRSLRAVTSEPIRFAVMRFTDEFSSGLEFRAWAGERALDYMQRARAARKGGFSL